MGHACLVQRKPCGAAGLNVVVRLLVDLVEGTTLMIINILYMTNDFVKHEPINYRY